jgi:hypothetical protein
MNHILSLQSEVTALKSKLSNMEKGLRDFRGFLFTEKFTGVDSKGERKDWISTTDVSNMIQEILNNN